MTAINEPQITAILKQADILTHRFCSVMKQHGACISQADKEDARAYFSRVCYQLAQSYRPGNNSLSSYLFSHTTYTVAGYVRLFKKTHVALPPDFPPDASLCADPSSDFRNSLMARDEIDLLRSAIPDSEQLFLTQLLQNAGLVTAAARATGISKAAAYRILAHFRKKLCRFRK